MSVLICEESVGNDSFCGRMRPNCFGGDHFFPLQLWGSFYVIFIFSVFHKLCVDGWMDDHVGFLKTPSDSRRQMWCGKFMRIRLYENMD